MSNKIQRINIDEIKNKELLFKRSYLVTTSKQKGLDVNPFYNNFEEVFVKEGLYYYKNKWINMYKQEQENNYLLLFGHAYNPVDLITREEDILKWLIIDINNFEKLISKINNLTGIFSLFIKTNDKLFVLQDASGIMPVSYGQIDDEVYLSSHVQLIADIKKLNFDPFIEKYLTSSFNKIGIENLPGIKTPYKELKTLTANTLLNLFDLSIERFFPNNELNTNKLEIKEICNILKNSMILISKKWNSSISLTGGVDSKMTLAATVNIRDKFNYFSFSSSEAEYKDVLAAKEICKGLNISHNHYEVPKEITSDEFEDIASIMYHNQAYTKYKYGSDVNKRYHLYKHTNVNMEVKSHVNEITRLFYYKKLGVKKIKFPLTARNLSNLSKRNFFNRKILKKTDKAFQEFINITNFNNIPEGYDLSDMFYWEHRMSQWASFTKQSFDLSNDTTTIYNNRYLLNEMLKYDFEYRYNDQLQNDVIKYLDKQLYNLDIHNDNAMNKKIRILMEKIFYRINNF